MNVATSEDDRQRWLMNRAIAEVREQQSLINIVGSALIGERSIIILRSASLRELKRIEQSLYGLRNS